MLTLIRKHEPDVAFDPDAIAIMVTAFEKAWHAVQNSGASFNSPRHVDFARAILAKRIIELAKGGERDQRRLAEAALLEFVKESGSRKVI